MRQAMVRCASLCLAILSAALLAPAQPASAAAFVPINGAGSTWSDNAINDWITSVAAQGMVVNYQPVGSTSGRQEFADGTTDWAASDIPYGVRDGNNFDPLPARGFTYRTPQAAWRSCTTCISAAPG
jgi:ABC-type phosphate transport system substrate-binding protein